MKAEQINALLHARIRDCAERKPARNKDDHLQRAGEDLARLKKCLGMQPDLPRTPLNAVLLKTNSKDGFVHEIWKIESRPGLVVSAHVYRPSVEGKSPVVVHAHEIFPHQSREPWVQARGISLALAGIASVIITPPGKFVGMEDPAERAGLGETNDIWQAAGAPWSGVYAWDLVRALDFAEGHEHLDHNRAGICGDGWAGEAAMLAFALEPRFLNLAGLFNCESYEHVDPCTEPWNSIPGLAELGDVADIIALRAPAPVMIVGANTVNTALPEAVRVTADKLRRIYKNFKAEDSVRNEAIFGLPDVNRRVRETLLAFYREQFFGEGQKPYVGEARPITDGRINPAPGWTVEALSSEVNVDPGNSSVSLKSLTEKALSESFPEEMNLMVRMVPWAKYGRVEIVQMPTVVRLQDEGLGDAAPDVQILPTQGIDLTACIHLGLSLPEIYAQILHLSIPGGPDGWESAAIGADALSSMIASVKTLIKAAQPTDPPTSIEAKGVVSSMVAHYLKLFRPNLNITTDHSFQSWTNLAATGRPEMVVPQAKYLRFPVI